MWTREELKLRAKSAIRNNYWRSVLVAIILTIFVGGGTTTTVTKTVNSVRQFSDTSYEYYTDNYYYDDDIFFSGGTPSFGDALFALVAAAVALIISLVGALLRIFIFNPLEVGGCRFFMENSEYQPTIGRLGFAFQNGIYGKTVLTLFLRKIYIFLWSLLLVVPGIIKSYEYRMVPYLLADSPEMTRQDAFRLSKELMYGQKWNAFVLDLSFIGWNLLSACTCGLLAIFYVNPYVQATNAELFLELKRDYFSARYTTSSYSESRM